jgi:hypothetical protein
MGAPLPLPSNLAMGAEQAKLDADLFTLFFLGVPFIHYVHAYDPFVTSTIL